jgi:uncharacterized protein YciI
MFVIELTHEVPLAEIDAHMAAHVIFLKKYYTSGNFLVSGRKIPRDAGTIVAVGKNRRQIEDIVKEDPFYEHGLAELKSYNSSASLGGENAIREIRAASRLGTESLRSRQETPPAHGA